MNICELADIIGRDLVITRFPNIPSQDHRFTCEFKNSETKKDEDDGLLISTYGEGRTPTAALQDYAKKIRGKLLVLDACSSNRREIWIPASLSAR
ncbi:MAG: hypothetical protein HYW70_03600 [Candidatus Nealsonbacteria bacterium]|nr:hypothetical protein [Candidatus Nealsonbacteria bacterium]